VCYSTREEARSHVALRLFGRRRSKEESITTNSDPESQPVPQQPAQAEAVQPKPRRPSRSRPPVDAATRARRGAAAGGGRRRRGGEATAEEQYVQAALTGQPVAIVPVEEAPPAREAAAPPAQPKKTRRGTRGGRRRRKAEEKEAAAIPAVTPAAPEAPPTLEALLARQAQVLESFTAEETRLLKGIQGSLSAIEHRLAGAGPLYPPTQLPRVGIFVDVPNIMYAAERFGVNIDFGRLREMLSEHRELVRASAYAPISDDPQARVEQQRFVAPFLNKGYRIVTKPLKRFADGSMKANFDVELAIDVLTMSERLDVVCLVSGDGDFRRLVEMVASKGVRVEVVAFAASTSMELRNVADHYIDLTQYLDELRAW
jgi:uncharacterized LabA/DUF88 family protein